MKTILLIAFTLGTMLPGEKDSLTQSAFMGAWAAKQGRTNFTLVFQDGYFSFVSFDIPGKKFTRTYGGTFMVSGRQLHTNIEFDSKEKEQVGSHKQFATTINGDKLTLDTGEGIKEWTRVDDGTKALAGNWRITGRMRDGKIEQMPLRARKTVKLLSGTRFQWMAINTETKEFSGTGGGTYTFRDGKYTEHIEFFSRDSSRVGATLTFDGSVNSKVWTHKGLSSKGEPIHEEWTREN